MKHLSLIILTLFSSIPIHAQVSPLVPVEWGQKAPYNDKCPIKGTEHTLAGCIAVTMSQMMSAYRYPSDLPWDGIICGDSIERIADLIYSAGLAAKTSYSLSNSQAMPNNQMHALVDSFGYDNDMIILSHNCVSDDVWELKIKSELDEGHPVMVSASDAKYGGHSFIIDGYNDDGYHVNWGWAGQYNGYYRLDSLKPSVYDFSKDQRIFLGCKPEDNQKTVVNYLEADCQLSDTLLYVSEIKAGKQITLKLNFFNRAYRSFQGYYYVYIVSPDGTATATSKYKNYLLGQLGTDFSKDEEISFTSPVTEGTYHLKIRATQLVDFGLRDVGLTGTTSFTILPSTDGIENPVINADDINNGKMEYYNAAGQRIAKPSGKRLIKRTRQGSQLVI